MVTLIKIAGNSYPGYNPPKQAPDSKSINQNAQAQNKAKLEQMAKEKPKLKKNAADSFMDHKQVAKAMSRSKRKPNYGRAAANLTQSMKNKRDASDMMGSLYRRYMKSKGQNKKTP